MSKKFDELRDKVRRISLIDPILLEEILIETINEIEKLSDELHQGFSRPS